MEENMLIIIIRSVLLYILIVFALRLMGKKQLAQLQPSELVTTILISNIATLSLEDSTVPMIYGVIPILMIVCMDVFMSFIMLKNSRFRRLVTGTPQIIITDGIIDRKVMKHLRYSVDELMEAMRSLERMPQRFPFFEEAYMPTNKYHKMFVAKWYLVLYQIQDDTVYVDYILDCRKDYSWLIR